MDFLDLLALLLFFAIGWLWYASLQARETAVAAARAACEGENLLLLDDTVAIARLGVARDGDGLLRVRRVYDFEYSHTGEERSAGSLVLLGEQVLVINLTRYDVPSHRSLH